jgi:signal transduction histidine kinase
MSSGTPSGEHLLTLNRLATIARLVAGAAHEVNNALQVIGGSVELLQQRTDLPEPVQKTLGRVAEQTARAAGAMAGVAALSRAQPDTSFRKVDLREIAGRAVALREYAIGRANLAVTFAPPTTPHVVQGQPLPLLQAALNLIQNAEQAIAPNGKGQIEVRLDDEGDHVALRVADDGPGVTPGEEDRIFEPFVTSRPRPESAGLGLPVARLIALAHHGSLVLEPAPSGAVFVLRVPKQRQG